MSRFTSSRPLTLAAVFAAAVVLTGGIWWVGSTVPTGAACMTAGPGGASSVVVSNTTGSLNGTFRPGAIQGFGANATAILYAGINRWDKPQDLSLPEIAVQTGTEPLVNLTNSTADLFHLGGVFGTVWNGSAWLVSGEATWGPESGGALVSYEAGTWTNLTPSVLPFFRGGGVWAVGWNGTSWLLAGNSTDGAALVALRGDSATNLTGLLPHNGPRDWIQLLAWNGTAWIVGGRGVFGVLSSSGYSDLLPGSPFSGGGVFGADWNGSAWVVGGGPPAAVAVLVGTNLRVLTVLPAAFNVWVNAVVATPLGWLLAGKGSSAPLTSSPQLALWNGELRGCVVIDLSSRLPSSFRGGQVQYAAAAPPLGVDSILLVGQGDLNEVTGYSVGAAALLSLVPPAFGPARGAGA